MSSPILEPAAQELADATSQPPLLYELGVDGARKVLDDLQAAPIDKPDVDEKWITVPAEVGDVEVRIVKPVGASGSLADDSVRPRRRLDPRQRRHTRPARPRAGGRRERRRRVRRVRPLARGAVPGRHRAGLRHGPLDHARRPDDGPRRVTTRGRRRLRRRQHGRRADDPRQAARRRHLRPPVAVLPGHRRRPGHRQLPASSPTARS